MDAETIKVIVEKGFSLIPEDGRPDINDFLGKLLKQFSDSEVKVCEGYRLAPRFDPEMAKYAYDRWEPRKGDILIAAYPKTGTTWAREIARYVIYRNNEEILEKTSLPVPIFEYLSWGPIETFEIVDKYPMKRRVFASHLPPPLLNLEKFKQAGVKIIYTIRNPKDQAVSFYKFHQKSESDGFNPVTLSDSCGEKEFYDNYFAGNMPLFAKPGEGYLEHVREWYKHKDDSNVMFLMYEDMKQDFPAQLDRICEFIGETLTDDEKKFVANKVHISTMQKDNARLAPLKLIREGNCGDWRKHLTKEQSDLVDDKVKKILGHTDITFKYEI